MGLLDFKLPKILIAQDRVALWLMVVELWPSIRLESEIHVNFILLSILSFYLSTVLL